MKIIIASLAGWWGRGSGDKNKRQHHPLKSNLNVYSKSQERLFSQFITHYILLELVHYFLLEHKDCLNKLIVSSPAKRGKYNKVFMILIFLS